MKELNVKQMERINGGLTAWEYLACRAAFVALGGLAGGNVGAGFLLGAVFCPTSDLL